MKNTEIANLLAWVSNQFYCDNLPPSQRKRALLFLRSYLAFALDTASCARSTE